ncbi:MAG: hypothetical protein ACPGSD_12665 [Flavobacteriales bacterium]
MKQVFHILIVVLFVTKSFSQIGIGTTTPHHSSILEVNSTNKGFLPPRLNLAQKLAIQNPAQGLIIYNLDYHCLEFYVGNDAWKSLGGCDFSKNFTFLEVIKYNGHSIIDSLGMTYYKEILPLTSTIEIKFTALEAKPFSFSGIHSASGIKYALDGNAQVGENTIALLPNEIEMNFEGVANITLVGADNSLLLQPRIDVKSLSANSWTESVDFQTIEIFADYDNNSNTNFTSNIWMDRNLGAFKVADSKGDRLSYGSLFQWGRKADGHEIIVTKGGDSSISVGYNKTTSTQSDNPNDALFITSNTDPKDWRLNQNGNLWQGVNGVNNPCPVGYRIPTSEELSAIQRKDNLPSSTSPVNSELKLPFAGVRSNVTGEITGPNNQLAIWSSTEGMGQNGTDNLYLLSFPFGNPIFSTFRAQATSVRCIKN